MFLLQSPQLSLHESQLLLLHGRVRVDISVLLIRCFCDYDLTVRLLIRFHYFSHFLYWDNVLDDDFLLYNGLSIGLLHSESLLHGDGLQLVYFLFLLHF